MGTSPAEMGACVTFAFFKEFITQYINKILRPKGHEAPLFLTSLDDYGRCNPQNRSEFLKNSSNYAKTVIAFKIKMPKKLCQLDDFVHEAINTLASNFKEGSDIGSSFVQWTKANKIGVYNRETGVTGKRTKIEHGEFVETVQNRLVTMFANKDIEYGTPLDRYLTYGHIKQFFVEHCGYNHWSEIPLADKKGILTNPISNYPDWEATQVKQLYED